MEPRTMLVDIKTGEIFSEILGWNKSEASLRYRREWTNIIYQYNGNHFKGDTPPFKNWENRVLYCVIAAAPSEPKQLT